MHKIPIGLKKVAVSCILKNQDQYLLLKRNKEPLKGLIVPVGGKIDPHESPENAVIREVKEETGLDILPPKFCGTLVETSPLKYNWISFIYLTEIPMQTPPYCNEGELQWVKTEQLSNMPLPPTDLTIYQTIAQNQSFMFSAQYDDQLNMLSLREAYQQREFSV